MRRLSAAALGSLPPDIGRPGYDPSAVRIGQVHLGPGAFHRAHAAACTDEVLSAGDLRWGIAAAALRSAAARDALAPQDHLYALTLRDAEGERTRVLGAIRRVTVAAEDPGAVVAALADPGVRVVTLTVTEKGYGADLPARRLDPADPDVARDLAGEGPPRSVPGLLAAGLRARRAARVPPFAALSCDNLPGNGALLRTVLGDFADALDPAFGRFVRDEVAFPSCMVDRIVPAATGADRDGVAARLGWRDEAATVAEPFLQWVIEDRFPLGRPDWERAGAEFVSDVAPHEAMKLRMLNGAHSLIAATGRVAGLGTVAEAVADPAIRALVRAFWAEVGPTLPRHLVAAAYAARLLARFDNPALRHRCAQVATDASRKIPQRWIEPLRERRAAGRPTPVLAFALAAWMRSCEGRDEAGRPMPLADPGLEGWAGRPGAEVPAGEAVRRMLAFAPVFGAAPPDEELGASVAADLAAIRARGVRAAAEARLRA